MIPPVLKHVEGFQVTGPSTRTQNADEFDEKTAKIPSLWQAFYSRNPATDAAIFGVYSDYASDVNGLYTVTAGVTSDNTQDKVDSVAIKTGQYLVFRGNGPMPAAVIDAWKRVWDYFSVENQHHRCYATDFEVYRNGDEVEIYIGVQ